MKSFRELNGEKKWFTELGVRIATNDLLNDIRYALKALEIHQKSKPKGK